MGGMRGRKGGTGWTGIPGSCLALGYEQQGPAHFKTWGWQILVHWDLLVFQVFAPKRIEGV